MRDPRLVGFVSALLMVASCHKAPAVKAKQDAGPIAVRVATVLERGHIRELHADEAHVRPRAGGATGEQ